MSPIMSATLKLGLPYSFLCPFTTSSLQSSHAAPGTCTETCPTLSSTRLFHRLHLTAAHSALCALCHHLPALLLLPLTIVRTLAWAPSYPASLDLWRPDPHHADSLLCSDPAAPHTHLLTPCPSNPSSSSHDAPRCTSPMQATTHRQPRPFANRRQHCPSERQLLLEQYFSVL